MTLADIKTQDWSLSITEAGAVVEDLADIEQCIYLIVTTAKGSDPLRPEFGADIFSYLDKPVNIVRPNVVREVYNAVRTWEPRVEVQSVTCDVAVSQVTITITWRDIRNDKTKVTVIPYGN